MSFTRSLKPALITPASTGNCVGVNIVLFSAVTADLQYSADAEKVSLLLKAPLYFDLEMYSNSSQLKKVGVGLGGQNICFMLTHCCVSTFLSTPWNTLVSTWTCCFLKYAGLWRNTQSSLCFRLVPSWPAPFALTATPSPPVHTWFLVNC